MSQLSRLKKFGLHMIVCFFIVLPAKAAITPDPDIHKDLVNALEMTFETPATPAYPYITEMLEASDRYDFPLALILAIARGESFFDANAKSAKGAIGIMQVMPSTASDYGVASGDLYNPAINIDVGVHFLSDLYRKFGDPYLTLAAYYCGCGGIDQESSSLRTDCDEYVKYIHTHLQTIISISHSEKTINQASLKKSIITDFDNFIDANDFLVFLNQKPLSIKFEVFRSQISLPDHYRYQYQIIALHDENMDEKEVYHQIKQATGFDFSRE